MFAAVIVDMRAIMEAPCQLDGGAKKNNGEPMLIIKNEMVSMEEVLANRMYRALMY